MEPETATEVAVGSILGIIVALVFVGTILYYICLGIGALQNVRFNGLKAIWFAFIAVITIIVLMLSIVGFLYLAFITFEGGFVDIVLAAVIIGVGLLVYSFFVIIFLN